jgi:hypothetical protein
MVVGLVPHATSLQKQGSILIGAKPPELAGTNARTPKGKNEME